MRNDIQINLNQEVTQLGTITKPRMFSYISKKKKKLAWISNSVLAPFSKSQLKKLKSKHNYFLEGLPIFTEVSGLDQVKGYRLCLLTRGPSCPDFSKYCQQLVKKASNSLQTYECIQETQHKEIQYQLTVNTVTLNHIVCTSNNCEELPSQNKYFKNICQRHWRNKHEKKSLHLSYAIQKITECVAT